MMIVEALKQHYRHAGVSDFLLESVFLNLQRSNKNQPTFLRLMKEGLQESLYFQTIGCGYAKLWLSTNF